MGHPFPIGMATGYSGVEIGYGEYIGYHHDSKKLFGSERSNNGTAVIAVQRSGYTRMVSSKASALACRGLGVVVIRKVGSEGSAPTR